MTRSFLFSVSHQAMSFSLSHVMSSHIIFCGSCGWGVKTYGSAPDRNFVANGATALLRYNATR